MKQELHPEIDFETVYKASTEMAQLTGKELSLSRCCGRQVYTEQFSNRKT